MIWDNLMRRGYSLSSWCCMFRCNGESVDHLLLHCSVAGVLWSYVFCSFGIQWVLPRWVVDLFYEWRHWFGKHSLAVWNIVPMCLKKYEHNRHTFEDVANTESQLLECFASSLFEWSRVWGLTSSTPVMHFISSLSSDSADSSFLNTWLSCVRALCTQSCLFL